VELFNTKSSTWIQGIPLGTPRDNAVALTILGKIYVFGGRNRFITDALNTVEVFDPLTNTWNIVSQMITPRRTFIAALVGGLRVIVMGGEGFSKTITKSEIYDVKGNTWTKLQDMSRGRHGAGIGNFQSSEYKIVVFGGTSEGNILTSVDVFRFS
jgi:N-acetylneuraminic acid mutarotase